MHSLMCPKCQVPLEPGRVLISTLVGGLPDFPGDDVEQCITLSPGGPGKLVRCQKCPSCGYSVLPGKVLPPPTEVPPPRINVLFNDRPSIELSANPRVQESLEVYAELLEVAAATLRQLVKERGESE